MYYVEPKNLRDFTFSTGEEVGSVEAESFSHGAVSLGISLVENDD